MLVPDWEQTAKDVGAILMASGDLLRECHEVLIDAGRHETAEKVRKFCDRALRCMESGKKWEDTPE